MNILSSSPDSNRNASLVVIESTTKAPLVLTGQALTNANPLNVAIVDGAGTQITSFGGGTQYTDGGTPPAHPIGNALVFDNGSSIWQAVNSTHGLPVNILQFPTAAALADGSSNPTTSQVGANLLTWDGGNWNRTFAYAPGDAQNNDRGILTNDRMQGWNGTGWDRLQVDGSKNLKITGTVGSNSATGAAVPANAFYAGGQARSSEQTATSNTGLTGFITDLVGKQIVLPYANPENFVSGRATATDTTSTSLFAAPASGLRNYITQITVWNSSAVNTYIKIQDGSGGTELYDIPAPAGGGAVLTLPTPLRQPTTATAIFFAANASANAVLISASGYKGA